MDSKEFAAQFKNIFELAISYSKIARTEGLFALKLNEKAIDTEKANKKDIFHYGLRLVENRTNNQTINEILTNIINQETDNNVKTLKTIQKEAVLAIQSGMNPRILALLLNSYVDNETAGVFEENILRDDYFDFGNEPFILNDEPFDIDPEAFDLAPKTNNNIKPDKNMGTCMVLSQDEIDALSGFEITPPDYDKVSDTFSQMILALDNRSLQKVFREIDMQELIKAIQGCGETVLEKVYKNHSSRALKILKEDKKYMGSRLTQEVTNNQKKILSIIKHLEDTGKIIISPAADKGLIIWNNETFLTKLEALLERTLLVSEKSLHDGFLEFEDNLDNTKIGNRDIFEYGLQLVVDDYNPKLIDKILSNIIKQEQNETATLFKTIQKEAILSIQAGETPQTLALKLNSYTNIPLDHPIFKKILKG